MNDMVGWAPFAASNADYFDPPKCSDIVVVVNVKTVLALELN